MAKKRLKCGIKCEKATMDHFKKIAERAGPCWCILGTFTRTLLFFIQERKQHIKFVMVVALQNLNIDRYCGNKLN